MNNKKGFTLIELLAVIVILAIVALVATPIVLNVIDGAREKSVKASMAGYADSVKLARIQYLFDHTDAAEPTWGDISASISTGGEKPTCGTETLTSGVIVLSNCSFSSNSAYVCSYSNGVASCTK